MPLSKTFAEELHALVERHLSAGASAADLVDEISKQAALIIDQNNLELELLVRPQER
jgi:hypothetical protein